MDALWYWTKIVWIPPFAISLINLCENHKLALEGCTLHIHRFSYMPSSCLRGQHFPYLFILLMPRTCLRRQHFPYQFVLSIPRTCLWGLHFPYLYIYYLEYQELVMEGCTFHVHLFSWVSRTCFRGLHFLHLSVLLSAKNLPLRAVFSISTYSLECQELASDGLHFLCLSILFSAKNVAQRAALSMSIYSLECQELAFEGCTFYVYLFSLVPKTSLRGLPFLCLSIL